MYPGKGTVVLIRPAQTFYERIKHGIKFAWEGKYIWDALAAIAADMLRLGLPLPDSLQAWTADVVEGKITRPKRDAKSTLGRDYGLAWMVRHLTAKLVITPTRNDGSPEHSACDLVADALNFNYKTVVNAYLNHKDAVF